MSDNFDTAGFREWWEEAKQKYDGDSQLCALRAWQHQQQRIARQESELNQLRAVLAHLELDKRYQDELLKAYQGG